MPDEKKKRLVEMLSARGIPLIEDDIYGDLQHYGPRPRCLKAFDKTDSVILCGSFSKTLAPGFRVGYIAPGKWHSKIGALKTTSTLSCAPLPELTVAEFLKNGGYDRYLRSVRHAFREQVHKMSEAVLENFPEGTLLSQPKGGFLLWCKLPANMDTIKLFKLAYRAGISIAPGPLFCPNGGFRNFIRINCGSRWTPQIENSVETLGRLARSICS